MKILMEQILLLFCSNLCLSQTSFNPRSAFIDNKAASIPSVSRIGLLTNGTASYWNPALLTQLNGFAYTQSNYKAKKDSSYFLGVAFGIERFGIGISRQTILEIISDAPKQSITSFSLGFKLYRSINLGASYKITSTSSRLPGLVADFTHTNSRLFDIGILSNIPTERLKLDYLGVGVNFQNIGETPFVFRNHHNKYMRNAKFFLSSTKYFFKDRFYISTAFHNDFIDFRENKFRFGWEVGFFDLFRVGFAHDEKKLKVSLGLNLIGGQQIARMYWSWGKSNRGVDMKLGMYDIESKRYKESLKKQKQQFLDKLISKRDSLESQGDYAKALKFNNGIERMKEIKQDDALILLNDDDDNDNRDGAFFGLMGMIFKTRKAVRYHFIRRSYWDEIDSLVSLQLTKLSDLTIKRNQYDIIIESKQQQLSFAQGTIRLANEWEKRKDYGESLKLYKAAEKTLTQIAYSGTLLKDITNAINRVERQIFDKFTADSALIVSLEREKNYHEALKIAQSLITISSKGSLMKDEWIKKFQSDIEESRIDLIYTKGVGFRQKGDENFKDANYTECLQNYNQADSLFKQILETGESSDVTKQLKADAESGRAQLQQRIMNALLRIAEDALKKGQFEKSLAYYEKIFKESRVPYDKTLAQTRTNILKDVLKCEVLLRQAKELKNRGAETQAEESFKQATELFESIESSPYDFWPREARTYLQKQLDGWR